MNEITHTAGLLIVEDSAAMNISAPPRASQRGGLRTYRELVATVPAGTINREVNARRLAACWNACDGIETADLEKLGPGGIETARQRRQQEKRLLRVALR